MLKKISPYTLTQNCCGCEACANICPTNAIYMYDDKYGYRFPCIETGKCINCKRCLDVCSLIRHPVLKMPLQSYAFINDDEKMLAQSASGGAFGALASPILRLGGCVFGCSWSNNLEATHIGVSELKQLNALQGSKYVQSRIGYTYREVKKKLQQNTHVLFSGTPCQVEGLYAYLGKEYSNLITCDLICHGVPNALMLSKYIELLESKIHGKIVDINFRDKSKGWSLLLSIKYLYNNKIKMMKINNEESVYYYHFLHGNIYRDSCYVCKYATSQRVADFTLGDYWGCEEIHPTIDISKGVSLVLVNTHKGICFLKRHRIDQRLITTNYILAQKYNGQLNEPAKPKADRVAILEIWRVGGMKELEKTIQVSTIKHIINIIKMHIPFQIKQQFKLFLKKVKKFYK